jgi:alpha-L-fucosidase
MDVIRQRRRVFGSVWLAATLAAGTIAGLGSPTRAQPSPATQPALDPYANETPAQRDARMKWWREAKFGLFIHWGVYAVPAGVYDGKPVGGIGEWIMNNGKIPVATYKAFAPQFTAAKYDPAAWAQLAHDAGMRYVVITSKHHDGFALFDSKVTDWDAVDASGAHRDLIAPLADAVRKQGLKFGLYYSQAQDWTHPGGAKARYKEGESWDEANKGDFDGYLRTIALPQVREILAQYKPDILWWDTPTWMNKGRADPFAAELANVPGIITNNRLGGGYHGDTETPEQFIPATGYPGRDWEVCMTMNDTWGFKRDDQHWKSSGDLIRKLVDIVSKGGNFLLNVGPTAEGEIPQASVERLREVGAWMKVNGEAIYATTASPFRRLPWGRCTTGRRDGGATLYLHVFDWPKDGKLVVPGLKSNATAATLLAGGAALKVERTGNDITIAVPAAAPDTVVSVIKLEIDGPIDVEQVMPKQRPDGVVALPSVMADFTGAQGIEVGGEEAGHVDALHHWSNAKSVVQWTFAVDRPGTFVVSAEVSGVGKTQLSMEIGKQKTPVTVDAAGGYEKFARVEFGRVTIDKPGEATLVLRPVAEQWKPINLRNLTLTPAP